MVKLVDTRTNVRATPAGLFIFNVATVEEAKALTESDPAIKAGRLVMELHPWYGSAGLVQVNDIHERITK